MGGKSIALLMAALQYADVPGYSALLLRRTYGELAMADAIMDLSHQWLRGKAHWVQDVKTWTFPSGARLSFGFLDTVSDRYRYQSAQFQFIGFDELTHFREDDYTYLFSRLRKRDDLPVPLRMRAASNPGGIGHEWVKQRFITERPGGQVFIPAKLDDNPGADREGYRISLSQLDEVTRRQLEDGDWDVADDGKLLSMKLIESAECDDCLWPGGVAPEGKRPELYLGIDLGFTKDPTVIWTWEKIGDVCWCRDIALFPKTSTKQQRDEIRSRITRNVIKCQIDQGAQGWEIAKDFAREYPLVVEPVQLTEGRQGQMAQKLKNAFLDKRIRIPSSAVIRKDFRKVRKVDERNGLPVVKTDRDGDGHGDRFWAAALGFETASNGKLIQTIPSAPTAYRPRGL